ncbi:hypothetical protein N7535_003741 [Penicillium sp. DV-2018c]|nr:hypothetical protein N7461_000558 [Penicillium sp. DV-2018c]KAJ5576815.1 hypothetical protein N7535_003741 [Penicillium sp. DV-2018c]
MGEDILSSTLTVPAEKIRNEIKAMIPLDSEEGKTGKAERLPTQIKGGVMYGGDNLAKKVSELMKEMKLGRWVWTVAQFHEAKEILNDSFQMYLIPLSDHLTLSVKADKGTTPQPVLHEGHYAYITINPIIICAGASVIFITPPA